MLVRCKATLVRLTVLLVAVFIAVSLGSLTTSAQGSDQQQTQVCTRLITQITDRIGKACNALNGDQTCYGNAALEVEYQSAEAAQPSPFAKPGDIVPLDDLKVIHTGALNTSTGEWGIALLKMRAGSLPATVKGQLVTFLIFGDTTLTPVAAMNKPSPAAKPCPVSSTRAGSLFANPAPGSSIVQKVPAGVVLEIYTRAPGSNWLFAQFQDKSGWIPADNVLLNCGPNSLPVDDPAVPSAISCISAFYFSTGISAQAACQDIPVSGLLIDSPNERAVTFLANGVNVTLRSTALLQAQPNGQMDITVLRGEAELTYQTVRRIVPAGQRLSIPLSKSGDPTPTNALKPSGSLGSPRPIDFNKDIQGKNGLCQIMRAAALQTDWCNRSTVQVTPRSGQAVLPKATVRQATVVPLSTQWSSMIKATATSRVVNPPIAIPAVPRPTVTPTRRVSTPRR